MKVKVLKDFIDKHTGKKHKKNEIFEVTEARFKEILKKGKFVVAVEETATVEKKK